MSVVDSLSFANYYSQLSLGIVGPCLRSQFTSVVFTDALRIVYHLQGLLA